MEKMKHQDGYAPSEEDTKKLNEMATWLVEHGYQGIMLVHKGDIGVSWVNEKSGDSMRHTFVNSLSHIVEESSKAAKILINGMLGAIKQICES